MKRIEIYSEFQIKYNHFEDIKSPETICINKNDLKAVSSIVLI